MNWQQTNKSHRYEYTGDNGTNERHLVGGGDKHKTGETDQGVTMLSSSCALTCCLCAVFLCSHNDRNTCSALNLETEESHRHEHRTC
jgi:hypothetical protein